MCSKGGVPKSTCGIRCAKAIHLVRSWRERRTVLSEIPRAKAVIGVSDGS